jgi:hypothetical protein
MPVLGTHTEQEREDFIKAWMERNPGSGTTTRRKSKGKKVGAGKPLSYHQVRRQKAARKWALKIRKEIARAENL